MKKREVLRLTEEEAVHKLDELYAQYLEFRFRKAMGTMRVAPLQGRVLRRNIARIKTILGEFHRGVRK